MNRRLRIAQSATTVAVALALVPAALAVRPPESGSSACAPAAARVTIENTWGWASPGSWGLPGQQLRYALHVWNDDIGCGSSTFTVRLSAPSGFAVSLSQSTITLSSASSGYVWANVTSPTAAADGDYPLTATVDRGGAGSSYTSWFKLYSSDTLPPKLYWMNPVDGGSLSGRSAYVGFASSDDHAVKRVELVLDNVLVAATNCDNVSYECQVSYKWSIRRVRGQHSAVFRSTDWLGNVASYMAKFTVN